MGCNLQKRWHESASSSPVTFSTVLLGGGQGTLACLSSVGAGLACQHFSGAQRLVPPHPMQAVLQPTGRIRIDSWAAPDAGARPLGAKL